MHMGGADGLRHVLRATARRGRSGLRRRVAKMRNGARHLAYRGMSCPEKALCWLREHEAPGGGIREHSESQAGYPEVSGYLIPTLLAYGEKDIAARFVRWLLSIQRSDGGFTDCAGTTEYVFDTGQCLRGLLAGEQLVAEAADAARFAAEFLCDQMIDAGSGGFGQRYTKSPSVPETVHLYVLPPMIEAAKRFDEPRFEDASRACMQFYCEHDHFLRMESLTHFLAYELEPLIDLGAEELARPVLDRLRELQDADGSIRGQGGVRWVCTPGLLQLAICWYKLGERDPADRAVEWA